MRYAARFRRCTTLGTGRKLMAKDYYDYLPSFLANLDPHVYESDNFLTLDLETTMRGDGNSPDATYDQNDIVCAVWKFHNDDKEFYHRGGICDQFQLIQDCYEADYIVAHNGKFDIKWCIRAGIDPAKILLADTMIAEYVLSGNLKAGKRGALALGTLVDEYFGERKAPYVDKLMKSGVCPSEIPPSMLEARNRKDVHQTEKLWLTLRDRMIDEDKLALFYTRCLFSPVLAEIELRGVHLDRKRVLEEHVKAKTAMDIVSEKLDLMLEGRNPRSPKQMQEFIYDVLKFKPLKKKGIEWRPTGEEILHFKTKTKKQREFLELKKEFAQLNADLSKNLDYFYGVVQEKKDCLFYAQFNQCQTVTHRLSSSGLSTKFEMFAKAKSIQLQNSPRKYKPLYSARRKGWKVIELDGAQIEFRVAGYIGQDRRICQDIIDGVDVHKFTASKLNSCTEEEVDKYMRTAAKADTFKPLYGGSYGTDDQMAYYAAFKEKYPGITKAQQRWEGTVLRTKEITHETGITFYYPGCSMSSSGYNKDFPSICNYPVQNLATAEVVPIAITAMWHIMKALEMQAFINNTVHDSDIVEAPEDELEEVYEIGKWCYLWWVYEYLDAVYDIQFNVPLGVGFQAGDHWGEADELPFDPQHEDGEFLTYDDGEVTVMAVPPTRMEGVDYSRLTK
jgi:DNA polymerase-1